MRHTLRFYGAHGCSSDTHFDVECDGFTGEHGAGVWLLKIVDGSFVPFECVVRFSACKVIVFNGKEVGA